MDKQKIDELLKELDLNINDYYILSGASLVLRRIKDKCGDLDLCVSTEAFEKLKSRYNIRHIDGKPNNLFQITDEIEAYAEPKENFVCEIVENYPLENINTILNFKKQRNLPKDRDDIIKIEKYIKDLKHEISCGAYVIHDDKILMVRHVNGGHWDFPKGHMEENETKEQTAIREVMEETGIEIKIISDKEYKNTYKPKMNVQKDVIFFEAEKIGGSLKNQEAEILELKWFELNEAIEKLTFEKSKDLFKQFLESRKL